MASGLATQCQVQIAYAIGIAKPVGINVYTFGTGKIDDRKIEQLIIKHNDNKSVDCIYTVSIF